MDDMEVWRRYEAAKRYVWVADALLILGGITLYFFESAARMHTLWLAMGLALITVGIALTATKWRCPVCKHRLPLRNFGRLRHCPHCAVNLDE